MTEPAIRAWLAEIERLGSEHPDWAAFQAWAQRARSLYEASRQRWRAGSPAIDVAALEGAYDLTPALLAIKAQV
jgi:hypothetical protein